MMFFVEKTILEALGEFSTLWILPVSSYTYGF